MFGLCDRECRLCFAVALWNERDPILKERLFGLTNPEGNHGEDVKECYFYLDGTPTHSYMKALYKYPQAAFPYSQLVDENGRRTRADREYELIDTGVFDENRYFDVFVEYAKAAPDDLLIRVTIANRGPEPARLHVLPTFWFRNTWSWGREGEGYWPRGEMERDGMNKVHAQHQSLGPFVMEFDATSDAALGEILFTENETNAERLFDSPNSTPYVKDAFHEYVVNGNQAAVNPGEKGSKCAGYYVLDVSAGGTMVLRMRLRSAADASGAAFGSDPENGFDAVFQQRIAETDAFYDSRIRASASAEERQVARQAFAGLLWTKQFYHYIVSNGVMAILPNLLRTVIAMFGTATGTRLQSRRTLGSRQGVSVVCRLGSGLPYVADVPA